MTTYRVPSRTTPGSFYTVTCGLDGALLCNCPASFNNLKCWHVAYVREEIMTTETSTALVPVKVAPSLALLPSERELGLIDQAAALAMSGAIVLPAELKTKAQVAAVMLYGLELGLRPMTALRHLYIVKGRVSPSAEVMAGMLMGAEPDARLEVVEINDTKCTMRLIRPSRSIDETYTVTWQDIVKAGLASGANAQYPQDRMRYHATKRLLRIYAPDVINAMDGPMIDGSPTYNEPPLPDELYNEGDEAPAAVWREAAPEPVQTAPAPPRPAPAPQQPQDELTIAYMDLVKERGADAGQAVMDWAIETWPGITGAKGKLDKSKLDGEQAMALVAEMRRYAKNGHARCADDAHEPSINPDSTLYECSVCGHVLEEPAPAEQQAAFA